MDVPDENPWAPKPAVVARPPPGAAAPSAAAPRLTTRRAQPEEQQDAGDVDAPPAASSRAAEAPTGAIRGGESSSRQLTLATADAAAAPAQVAAPTSRRRNVCSACCMGCHRTLASSPFLLGVVLVCIAIISLGTFGYTAWLLKATPSAGSGCNSSTSCSVPSANCVSVVVLGSSCANVCLATEVVAISPVRFTYAGAVAGDPFVACPFPALNSSWMLSVTFLAALFNLTSVLVICLDRRGWIVLHSLIACLSGCLCFYVMCIDAAAVRAGLDACNSRFSGLPSAPFYANKSILCDSTPFITLPILDALLFFLQWWAGALCWLRFRNASWLAKPGSAGESAPAGGAATDDSGAPVQFGAAADPEERLQRAREEREQRDKFRAGTRRETSGGTPAFD